MIRLGQLHNGVLGDRFIPRGSRRLRLLQPQWAVREPYIIVSFYIVISLKAAISKESQMNLEQLRTKKEKCYCPRFRKI